MGTPDEKVWPGVSKLPNFSMIGFREYIGEDLRQSFSSMDEDGFNLMMRMLTLDPKQRITAQEALEHEYFNE
jgi:serine/threonine protein kinase